MYGPDALSASSARHIPQLLVDHRDKIIACTIVAGPSSVEDEVSIPGATSSSIPPPQKNEGFVNNLTRDIKVGRSRTGPFDANGTKRKDTLPVDSAATGEEEDGARTREVEFYLAVARHCLELGARGLASTCQSIFERIRGPISERSERPVSSVTLTRSPVG